MFRTGSAGGNSDRHIPEILSLLASNQGSHMAVESAVLHSRAMGDKYYSFLARLH